MRRALFRFLALFRGRRADADLTREIEAHLQLLQEQFMAQGMTPREAYYAARRAFGGVEQIKEAQRDTRTFRLLDNGWLDIKLGARMLRKYPGLTIVGGLGVAVGIAIASGAFTVMAMLMSTDLPLPDGDRIISIQNWDTSRNRGEYRVTHDLAAWRQMTTLRDVGAYRTVGRNLIAPGAQVETVRIAEMNVSGFRVAGVTPSMGRYLLDEDERPGAANVVVIGHDVWTKRFAGAADVIGREIQLGAERYTIVGVMPEGYAFPVDHKFWIPLRWSHVAYEPRTGPEISVFGTLAPGASLESAQAEIAAVRDRLATAAPKPYERVRASVLPYVYPYTDMDDPDNALALGLIQLLVTMLLVIVCVNVAILVYARTVTRQAEIAVRSALGASRRRIVGQLFIEALVLTGLAACAGLFITRVALLQVWAALRPLIGSFPFWMTFDLSTATIVYALLMAVLAAAIIGVVPALKATGRKVQNSLRLMGAGGSGMQLGTTWTLLVVLQVGFAVALLPVAVYHAFDAMRYGTTEQGIEAREVLSATIYLDPDSSVSTSGLRERTFSTRLADRQRELLRRLQSESAVAAATVSMELPGQEAPVFVEIEGVPAPGRAADYALAEGTNMGHLVRVNRVDESFFDLFEIPLLSGRFVTNADAGVGGDAVVVSRSFVDRFLGGANPIGRHVKYIGRSGDISAQHAPLDRWYRIVGVASDFPIERDDSFVQPKMYHAAAVGEVHPLNVTLRIRGGVPATFAATLRETAAAVDPALQLRNVRTFEEALQADQRMFRLIALGIGIVTFSVVLLSCAGIYALMSVTVSQRRKEIGIRAALGADHRRLVVNIFSRALAQLAAGAILGAGVALLLENATGGELMRGHAEILLPIVAVFMMLVGLLAAIGPARRGLRINPTEALRAE